MEKNEQGSCENSQGKCVLIFTSVRNLIDPSSFSCSFRTLRREGSDISWLLVWTQTCVRSGCLAHQSWTQQSPQPWCLPPHSWSGRASHPSANILSKTMKTMEWETWNAGSILPDRTTTMGDSEPVTTIKPFQIIRAEDTIIPKDSTWQ